MSDYRTSAKEKMAGYCNVCQKCDGRFCKGNVPGMGGLGTGSSFMANIDALDDVRLNMRLIHNAENPDTSASILGKTSDMPVIAAPIGGVSFNMGGGVSEHDYIDAVVGGCKDSNIIGCTGDGVPPEIFQSGIEAIQSAAGHGIPFIKPWEDAEFRAKLEQANAAGPAAIGIDIDAAGLITLKLMGRPVSPKPLTWIKSLVAELNRPLVLKGIMTVTDALLAVEAGASAIVVSNHGGRVLDHTPGTAEVLPEIADAVKGKIDIWVDGGIRSGADVLKMIALGADAVMIGRPFSVASVGGGRDAVCEYVSKIKSELTQAMVLTGCNTLSDVDRSVIRL